MNCLGPLRRLNHLKALAGIVFGFMACGATRHATIAFNSGIVPVCIERLSSQDMEARIKSAWILGNLAADETECAESLMNQGVLDIMVEQMEVITNANEISEYGSYSTMLLWAINHFLKSAPNLTPAIVSNSLHRGLSIDYLSQLTRISRLLCIIIATNVEDAVLEECCFGLATLTQIEEDGGSPFSDEKLSGRLIRLLQRGSNVNLQKAALQLVGALTARSDEYTTRLLQFDLLSVLHELIEHKLGEDVCWVISNIVSDNIEHLNIVVKDPRIIPTVVRLLKVDAAGFDEDEYAGRTRECCAILANIINKGQIDSIRHMVSLGGISALCTALRYSVEMETLILLLDALWKVILFGEGDRIVINDASVNLYFELFKESGGYEGLLRMQSRKEQQVAEAAEQMLVLVRLSRWHLQAGTLMS